MRPFLIDFLSLPLLFILPFLDYLLLESQQILFVEVVRVVDVQVIAFVALFENPIHLPRKYVFCEAKQLFHVKHFQNSNIGPLPTVDLYSLPLIQK